MSANFNIVDLLKRKGERQPFDERLPSGQSVPELLRQPSSAPAIQRAALAVPRGDVVELLKQLAANPTAESGGPPNPYDNVRSASPAPVSVGASTTGQSPIDRQQSLIDLMRATPAGQKVRQHGDEIEVSPPEQSPSRVKNALVGLLLGLGQGGLPGGIAMAAEGAIKPNAIQELLKQKHVAREEGQLERQVAIDDKRADGEYRRAQIDTLREGRRQYVERTDGVYEISREYPNGRRVSDIPSEARAKPAASRHYFERDDGVYYVDDEHPQGVKLSGVPGKPPSDAQAAQAAEGEALADSTRAAADELKVTLDQQKGQLTENERALAQKEAYWRAEAAKRVKAASENLETLNLKDALEQVKAEDPDLATYEQTTENTKRLRDAISDGDKRMASMQQDVRQGQAKGARRRGGPAATTATQQSYAGRTMSPANLARYAKDKGISEAEARRQVEAQGVRVQ